MVDIKYMEFDKYATEKEKEKLKLTENELTALRWFAGVINKRPAGATIIIKNLLKRYE